MCVVAKKIAAILAENEVEVGELNEIFKCTKRFMVVSVKPKRSYMFGRIEIQEHPDENGEIGNGEEGCGEDQEPGREE